MNTWHFIIDIEKCEDCNNCFMACKDEHVDNDWPGIAAPQPRHGHRWMNIMRTERGKFPLIDAAYRPTPCQHCDNAPCLKAAQNGAVFRREDGIVIIDPQKAKGQKNIMKACPYEAIYWNETLDIPQKCTFCAHLLDDGWKEPRCVQACPTGALTARKLDEAEAAALAADPAYERLRPELNTGPKVYYRNLFRFDRCFAGGSLARTVGGVTDCVEGAKVVLSGPAGVVGEAVTDNFGDFKFDGLKPDGGDYAVEIAGSGFRTATIRFNVNESVNLGTIFLEPTD